MRYENIFSCPQQTCWHLCLQSPPPDTGDTLTLPRAGPGSDVARGQIGRLKSHFSKRFSPQNNQIYYHKSTGKTKLMTVMTKRLLVLIAELHWVLMNTSQAQYSSDPALKHRSRLLRLSSQPRFTFPQNWHRNNVSSWLLLWLLFLLPRRCSSCACQSIPCTWCRSRSGRVRSRARSPCRCTCRRSPPGRAHWPRTRHCKSTPGARDRVFNMSRVPHISHMSPHLSGRSSDSRSWQLEVKFVLSVSVPSQVYFQHLTTSLSSAVTFLGIIQLILL